MRWGIRIFEENKMCLPLITHIPIFFFYCRLSDCVFFLALLHVLQFTPRFLLKCDSTAGFVGIQLTILNMVMTYHVLFKHYENIFCSVSCKEKVLVQPVSWIKIMIWIHKMNRVPGLSYFLVWVSLLISQRLEKFGVLTFFTPHYHQIKEREWNEGLEKIKKARIVCVWH